MSRAGFPLLLAAAATAPACGTIELREPVEARIEAPESWLGADAGAPEPVSAAWWSSFDSPALTAAVEQALAANRDLAVAAARVEQAAAQARIAGADVLPTVGASLSRDRSRNVYVGLPIPGADPLTSYSTTWSAAIDVSWEVDLWGRVAAGRDAAEASLDAAWLDGRAAAHAIAGRTARAWIDWTAAAGRHELATTRAASLENTASIVRERYDAGLVPALDVRLVEANAAQAQAEVAAQREARERAHRALDALLGRVPTAAPGEAFALPEPPPPAPAGLPSELLERRPDLASAAARLRAANEQADAARAALLPALRLTGSAGRLSSDAGDLLDSDFDIWSLAAGLTQPLFQGGRLRAAADLEDARAREAAAAFEGAFLTALGEVETALATEAALADYEARLAVAGDSADAAYELALESYVSGRAALLEVLDAQRAALDVDAQRLDARRRRLGARVDLHLALGGGFEDLER